MRLPPFRCSSVSCRPVSYCHNSPQNKTAPLRCSGAGPSRVLVYSPRSRSAQNFAAALPLRPERHARHHDCGQISPRITRVPKSASIGPMWPQCGHSALERFRSNPGRTFTPRFNSSATKSAALFSSPMGHLPFCRLILQPRCQAAKPWCAQDTKRLRERAMYARLTFRVLTRRCVRGRYTAVGASLHQSERFGFTRFGYVTVYTQIGSLARTLQYISA